jgi:hypothetical protein
MSQIAPDIPELEHLHEIVRPFVWTRAMMRAIRSPGTHAIGMTCLALAGVAIVWGLRTRGWMGAAAVALVGVPAAVTMFFKFIIPWQARRWLPVVEKEVDWDRELGEAMRAHDQIKSMADKVHDP